MTANRHEHEILNMVGRWTKAERVGDPDALDRLLVADFVGVGPRGFLLTKEQWIDRYRSGDLQNTSFELRDPQVRNYGVAAVIVGTQVQETSYQGHDTSGEFRATLVAVRPDDRWQLAGIQLSPIAGPLQFAESR